MGNSCCALRTKFRSPFAICTARNETLSPKDPPNRTEGAEGKKLRWSAAGFVCDLKALALHVSRSNFNNSDCLPASGREWEMESCLHVCFHLRPSFRFSLALGGFGGAVERARGGASITGYTGKVGNRGDSCVSRHTIRCACLSVVAQLQQRPSSFRSRPNAFVWKMAFRTCSRAKLAWRVF